MANAETGLPIVYESKTQKPSSTRKQHGVSFLFLEHPNGTSTSASRKRARSYSARQGHARIRHEQAARFRESKRREAMRCRPRGDEALSVNLATPSPRTLLSTAPPDPFASAARPVSRFEHFLIDHFLSVVVPAGHFYTPSFPSPQEYLRGTRTEWIPLALTDPGMLCGILVSACRSLHALCGEGPYLEKALNYKMICMASVRRDISDGGRIPQDASIAKAIILAGDEVAIGNLMAGKRHIDAANHLVALRGGSTALGTNGFLGGIMDVFSCDKRTDAEALNLIINYSHFNEPVSA